LTVKRMIVGG